MISVVAWLLAGMALWFTRSVLDVFSDGRRTVRVAMFPSAPELLGLVVLALLCAGAFALAARRWSSTLDGRRETLLQISLPLFALLLLILPYLPWVPDVVLPLRSLAGPAALIVWFVVVGQVAITTMNERARFRWRKSAGDLSGVLWPLVAGLVTVVITNIAIHLLRGTLTAVALAETPSPLLGDRGWVFITLAGLTSAMSWIWVTRLVGIRGAATFAWAVIFLSAPVLFTSASTLPDIPAAFCLTFALAWRAHAAPNRSGWIEYLSRGLALGFLPWLSITYVPVAAAAAVMLGIRAGKNRRAALALFVPFTVSLVRRLAIGHEPLVLANPLVGMLGLLFDQEFGIFVYAPAMLLGFTGLWRMLRARDGQVRQRGREIAVVIGALLVTTGSLAAWWGGTPPGHPLVPALPLLALPIAWAYTDAESGSVRRSVYQLLALLGVAIALSMLLSEQGALIPQDRDGSSRFLQWLTMLWPAWQVGPSIAADGLQASAGLILLWVIVGAIVAWISRKQSIGQQGSAALTATVNVSAAMLVVAMLGPAVTRAEPPSVTEPEARSRMPMLDEFDSLARPHAVIYRPFTLANAAEIPPLLKMAAVPGLRSGSQPIKVLMNARYALAAGDYAVEIAGPPDGEPVHGTVALQVGRIGTPLREWPVELAPNHPWRAEFSLPVDAEFVGFVTSDSLSAAASLRLTPLHIVNRNNRESSFHGAPRIVLSATGFPTAAVFFHDEDVYPERNGFWVHGESTAYMTVAPNNPSAGVTLRVHSGAIANTVTIETSTWGEQFALKPGTPRDVHVPAPARPGPFLVRVSTAKGFVPAEAIPGNGDRRILGCWVEIVPE